MMRKGILVLFVGLVLLVACSKTTKKQDDAAQQSVDVSSTVANDRNEPPKTDRSKYVAVQDVGPSPSNPATAHSRYLKDTMQFVTVPDYIKFKGQTAVIGSRVALFYPDAKITSEADLASLPTGIPIPLGTVLPIGEKVKNSNEEIYERTRMFKFQDNFNWFYPTEFQGKSGLVFGADLYGFDSDLAHNRITSIIYKNLSGYANFFPINGYNYLEAPVSKSLVKDRLSTQAVDPREYHLSLGNPDDMISLYQSEVRSADDEYKPIFVTTDIFAHSMHRFFDYLLQDLEEENFKPRLADLIASYRAAIKNQLDRKSQNVSYTDALVLADNYFAVAEALLALAPTKVITDDYTMSVGFKDVDQAKVLAKYKPEVQAEIKLILAANGTNQSAIFGFSEDYSQYKPRGHYTKNEILGSYFRAMMWFGRINIELANPSISQAADIEKARKNVAVALCIAEITKQNKALYRQWEALFDPITDLIGLSDDVSLAELIPFMDFQHFKVPDDIEASKIDTFMQVALEKLRSPLINSYTVFESTQSNSVSHVPIYWRLFGQRFTYDSWIQDQVRDHVSGLAITKAFGSKTADDLLAKEYQADPEFKKNIDNIANQVAGLDPQFWRNNYYTATLDMIRAQARFEPGTGFYFTESPAWGIKSQISALGTWAELRHDTILYVKQSGSERAGDGSFEPTYRTIELPKPINYIEPNLEFFKTAAAAIKLIQDTLTNYQLLSENKYSYRLMNFTEIIDRASLIVAQEIADKPIESEDNLWIHKIAADLAPLVIPFDFSRDQGYVDEKFEEQLKMATIADVYTNSAANMALEVGVGKPERIYVPLNDGQGGKRIAIGYVLTYYEFWQDSNNRLTDEDWRAQVYDVKKNNEDKKPAWAQGRTLAARPYKEQ